MPQSFRVRKVPELGQWIPDHPGLDKLTYFVDDGKTSRALIRQALFSNIDGLRPGEYVLDESIDDGRKEVFERIDERTYELIEKGFEHQGIVFSCSERAQIRYNGMLSLSAGLTYPLEINSLDDKQRLTLASAEETVAFCVAAATYVRDQVDSGTTLKQQACEATTQEELDAIVDTRGVELPVEPEPQS